MIFKMVPVKDVKPSPYNPRDITDQAFEGLKESIKKFGFVDTILINTRSDRLVGGHQRLKAAEALGIEEVPAIFVDLSPSEEKALNITLNNALISGHYTDTLRDLLTEIRVDFSTEELQSLRLDELEVKTDWDDGDTDVKDFDENLDGIIATIKVKVPQELAPEVKEWLESMIRESGYEGLKVV